MSWIIYLGYVMIELFIEIAGKDNLYFNDREYLPMRMIHTPNISRGVVHLTL